MTTQESSMQPDDSVVDDLWQRIRRLEQRNRHLQYQNGLLEEALDTICCAFLNNSKNLETAIQTAMTLQQRAHQPPPPETKIKPT
jgi:hypothetical protein